MIALPQPAAQRPTREAFAAGDIVVRFPASENARLVILSPIAKPGWRARTAETQMRALFPGTAIRFEEKYFEVRAISPPGAGAPSFSYDLRPWEERFPIREAFDYTREECERVAETVRDALRKQATARSLAWALPLIGLLPARVQLGIEEEYGLPAARATFISALLLLGFGVLATMVGAQAVLAASFAGPRPSPISLVAVRWLPLSVYLTIESFIRYRLSHAVTSPVGSLPIAAPLLAALWLRDLWRAAHEPQDGQPQPDVPGLLPADARDEVRDLVGGGLEILSLLDKPHWGPRTAVHFRGRWWALAARAPLPNRWRFELEPWAEEILIQDAREYAPEEVRAIAFDTVRERHRATVESIAPLLGLLEESWQRRLEEVYGYSPRTQTGWSVIAVAASAAFTLGVAVSRLRHGLGGLPETAIVTASAWLLIESVLRGLAWQRGRILGSTLAVAVRPLARRFLRLGQSSP